jgi:hypothetical protein
MLKMQPNKKCSGCDCVEPAGTEWAIEKVFKCVVKADVDKVLPRGDRGEAIESIVLRGEAE